jgi:ribonucleoside-diphosphate reductase alpha chain
MTFQQGISRELFTQKYMINGETDPEQVFKDIATEIASVENPKIRAQIRERFYDILNSGKFIPGGRIMANARPYVNPKSKNYNNCFTIDIEDSMEGIYGAVHEDAMISRMGGGVGFDVSKLRPEGSVTSNGGEASGPVSFLKVFDASAKTIASGGHRRAAHIALIDDNHPDVVKFVLAKQGDKNKALTQFNISVRLTDKFMARCQEDPTKIAIEVAGETHFVDPEEDVEIDGQVVKAKTLLS